MSNVLQYRGFAAAVEFDADDGLLVGHVAGVRDIVGFHATTAEGIGVAFRQAVDEYVDACSKAGKAPEKPYSGKVMFRISPDAHARAAIAAALAGKSLNQWAQEALLEKAG